MFPQAGESTCLKFARKLRDNVEATGDCGSFKSLRERRLDGVE